MASYTASDIDTLALDRDRVQQQPQIYIPDKHLAGATHLIREIIDNAQDETVLLKDGVTEVEYDENSRICVVRDNGRGIPHEKMKDLCEVLHSSGKFHKGNNNAYKYSSGLHGVGLKITNFLSEKFTIASTRDGSTVTRIYEDGMFIKEKKNTTDKDEHGTVVSFKISNKYLNEVDKIKAKDIMDMIMEKTDSCPGLVTKFKGIDKNGKEVKEKYIGLGILQLMTKYTNPTSKIFDLEWISKEDDLCVRLAFGYDSKAIEGSEIRGWTNYIYNKNGGTHVDALSNSIYDFFKKYMINNIFTEKEKKDLQIRREDIKLGLCGVVVVFATSPEFYGQYKEKMISESIGEDISEAVNKYLNKLPDADLRMLSNIIKDNIKARISSIRARQQVKKVGNGISRDRIDKFYPQKMGNVTDFYEVYLTEGLSAASQVEKARFPFQAVYQLRGKIDNIYDMTIPQLSKIPIIDDISRIIGIKPGQRGNINIDRLLGLTDAD